MMLMQVATVEYGSSYVGTICARLIGLRYWRAELARHLNNYCTISRKSRYESWNCRAREIPYATTARAGA